MQSNSMDLDLWIVDMWIRDVEESCSEVESRWGRTKIGLPRGQKGREKNNNCFWVKKFGTNSVFKKMFLRCKDKFTLKKMFLLEKKL